MCEFKNDFIATEWRSESLNGSIILCGDKFAVRASPTDDESVTGLDKWISSTGKWDYIEPWAYGHELYFFPSFKDAVGALDSFRHTQP